MSTQDTCVSPKVTSVSTCPPSSPPSLLRPCPPPVGPSQDITPIWLTTSHGQSTAGVPLKFAHFSLSALQQSWCKPPSSLIWIITGPPNWFLFPGLAHLLSLLHMAVRLGLLKCNTDHLKILLKSFNRSPLPSE